jgi:hypothetical protein
MEVQQLGITFDQITGKVNHIALSWYYYGGGVSITTIRDSKVLGSEQTTA